MIMWEWVGVLNPSENDYVICGCSLNSELVMLLGAGTSSRELKAAWESSVGMIWNTPCWSVYHKLEMRGKIFANQSVFVMSAEKGL